MYEVNNGDYQSENYEELVNILAEHNVNIVLLTKNDKTLDHCELQNEVDNRIKEVNSTYEDWKGVQLSAQQSYNEKYII